MNRPTLSDVFDLVEPLAPLLLILGVLGMLVSMVPMIADLRRRFGSDEDRAIISQPTKTVRHDAYLTFTLGLITVVAVILIQAT